MQSAPEVGADIAGQLRLAALRLLRRLRSEYGPEGLSAVQFSALSSLYRNGSMSPRELATLEQVQPPTVTRLIASLERADLVTRRVHPKDRRQLIIELTPSGTKLIASATACTDHWFATHLAALTDDERAVIAGAIPIINKIVSE
jgi:DNA-binding MarR family transcriptional regulator